MVERQRRMEYRERRMGRFAGFARGLANDKSKMPPVTHSNDPHVIRLQSEVAALTRRVETLEERLYQRLDELGKEIAQVNVGLAKLNSATTQGKWWIATLLTAAGAFGGLIAVFWRGG